MTRILFVDDDRHVLEGLERALFALGPEWDADFANSGEAALARMNTDPADVIVSDMRMPGIDGATLLEKVCEQWPDTLRIVLSGHTERESAMRAMSVAHQFISKPCSAGILVSTIQRLLEIRGTVEDPELRQALGRVRSLPAAPRTYLKLEQLRQNPACTMEEVADIVELDPAISASVLKLANSAYFRRGTAMNSIQNAIQQLGLSTLLALVLAAEAFPESSSAQPKIDLEALRQASLTAARLASVIATRVGANKDAAATAALLANTGRLLVARLNIKQSALETRMPASLAQIGAYLLGAWGLPDNITLAVRHQHEPASVEPDHFGIVCAVHFAVALAGDGAFEPDIEHLDRLGMSEHWDHWQQWLAFTRNASDEPDD